MDTGTNINTDIKKGEKKARPFLNGARLFYSFQPYYLMYASVTYLLIIRCVLK